ncbi:MAG: Fe-S cluster assembly protein SufD [Balneolaceae bacterium]|nr:Fe-S cluster assembly protein SufD [Balneolaceae bacterium]
MATLTKTENSFLTDLLEHQQELPESEPLLNTFRSKGAEEVRNMSFPTPKDEEWRFIKLRELYEDQFVPAVSLSESEKLPDISNYYLPESDGARLVFVNGAYSDELSTTEHLPDDLLIGNIGDLVGDETAAPLIEKHLNQYGDFEDDIFTSFNTAFLRDGPFIYLPDQLKVETPVHLLFIQTDASENYFLTPRCLIVAGKQAELTLVEEHVGLSENKYFNLPVVEVNLEENAYVKHTKIQRDSKRSIHFGRVGAHVRKHANYESYTITLGASLSRNEPRITQLEEEVEFTVDGLVLINGNQVSDTHSVMDHRKAFAESHQLHKCIVDDNAHSVFNGKIFVRQHAQKIDSFQENRNLLLSEKGMVDTKPQLEIFADDVKCTHGATVGQLDENEVFYLKSRGLNENQARELLTYAFALETIENISVDSVQKLLVEEVRNFTDKQLDTKILA